MDRMTYITYHYGLSIWIMDMGMGKTHQYLK